MPEIFKIDVQVCSSIKHEYFYSATLIHFRIMTNNAKSELLRIFKFLTWYSLGLGDDKSLFPRIIRKFKVVSISRVLLNNLHTVIFE